MKIGRQLANELQQEFTVPCLEVPGILFVFIEIDLRVDHMHHSSAGSVT